ncbi:MAG: glycosyl hydrolase [Candidatus Hydrogenedentota bacterium]
MKRLLLCAFLSHGAFTLVSASPVAADTPAAIHSATEFLISSAAPAHMDTATSGVYTRMQALPGVLIGSGYHEHIGPNGHWRLGYPMAMEEWGARFGSLPACFEFELGEHRRKACERDWFSARIFARQGGLPVFALVMNNMSVPFELHQSGSAWDRRNGLFPVLPGGDAHDSFVRYIRTLAGEFRAFGHPCLFRPFHEMNGTWFWWCGNPDGYRVLWWKIFDIFRQEGIRNVIWCWNPDWGRTLPGGIESSIDYYPGDTYVDVLAADIYCNESVFPSYGEEVVRFLNGIAPTKPIFLGEFGPVARADFWGSFPDRIRLLPRIRGIMLWMGRGWDSWGSDPERGSLIDETTPDDIREAFRNFLDADSSITLDEWTHR